MKVHTLLSIIDIYIYILIDKKIAFGNMKIIA